MDLWALESFYSPFHDVSAALGIEAAFCMYPLSMACCFVCFDLLWISAIAF